MPRPGGMSGFADGGTAERSRSELAQAPGGGAAVVARIPTECVRADIAVARDGGTSYLLPQIPSPAALHSMVRGSDLLVSARGLGVLVFDGFIPAAAAPAPPHIVLADGTALSASEVLSRPAETVSLAACASGAGVAAALAQVVPAGGAVAQAPAAPDPTAVQDGGRFDSVFSASTFDGLNYGDISPVAFGRLGRPLGGRGLLRTISEIVDLLGLGTNEADAFIPFSDKPVFAPTGAAINTDALIASEGVSVYLSGLAQFVGIPDARNLSVAADPLLVVTLEHDGAGFSNLVGFYKIDAAGAIVDIDVLWLNASLTDKGVAPDFFGQVADRTLTVFVPPETSLGFFLIADGGGSDANLALFKDLFADLKLDPTASWQANLDAINAHLRFDPATGHVEVETDPGVFKPLVGATYFSHDPTLDSDYRTDLTLTQNAHTVSGVQDGLLWIGFEDLPFVGDIHTKGDAIVDIGGGDLDYNDLLFSIDILYPPVAITPAQWHPTTQIFNSLAEGLGALTQASYVVSGLTGDGVTLTHDGLSPGWTLAKGADVDAFGNGSYALLPPGGVATAAQMIAELNKIAITVPGDPTLVGRPPVTVDFAVTDTLGLSDSASAHLNFSQGGPSPPAPADVQIHETYVPPPMLVTIHETFG